MNIFDIVIVILLAYSLFRGISKGFVIEISGMIALFLGILLVPTLHIMFHGVQK